MGRPQRAALQFLWQVIGELWNKEVRRDDLPWLRELAVEAVCVMECHFPATELDIKMHNIIHLAYALQAYGASFTFHTFHTLRERLPPLAATLWCDTYSLRVLTHAHAFRPRH